MKTKPNMSFWGLWNLSFGFFGVQIAYALQSANVSRIFNTLGADPHDLSYFWILPPLMGLIVQPIVGAFSDRTWTRFGRRIPYLIAGAAVAIAVMCILPNAGSFHLSVAMAITVGLIALMLLDTSINMAMQPFKMLVGDMVNEKQKGLAYSIQSFLCNAGSIVGFVFPFFLTWIGIQNTAAAGVVPPTVIYSFYAGAAILLLCVIYSIAKIREWPPKEYNEYNGVTTDTAKPQKSEGLIKLLRNAPSTFWTVGLVQFFCWFAFLFMWTYTNGTVAKNAFDTPERATITGITYTDAEGSQRKVNDKFILAGDEVLVSHGKALAAGIVADNGRFVPAENAVTLSGDTLLENSLPASEGGIALFHYDETVNVPSGAVIVNGTDTVGCSSVKIVDRLSRLSGHTTLTLAAIVANDPATGKLTIENSSTAEVPSIQDASYATQIELNTESPQYQAASNWVGILFAVQAVGSVIWAVVLPMFRSRKFSYFISLLLGGIGFATASFVTNQYMLIGSFLLIGCAWAAMLAWPFTILTNSLKSGNIGSYLGLFNCSICIPQIVAALVGGAILKAIEVPSEVAPQSMMMLIAGISLAIGSLCVFVIRESSSEPEQPKAAPYDTQAE